ncbi:hypothetical protein CEXT_268441 [Caerostris extrusa]|uniref:Uncharacterized protein n=1 Tax=Caerostris extrusa TaxID=172846 RepID=A0AAV4SY74_CAEEX|nr:hypothetical protein CEXT_268441 [Caerostris extrusa]
MLGGEKHGSPGNLTAKGYLHNVHLGRWISIKQLAGSIRRIRAPSGTSREVYASTLSKTPLELLLHTLVAQSKTYDDREFVAILDLDHVYSRLSLFQFMLEVLFCE